MQQEQMEVRKQRGYEIAKTSGVANVTLKKIIKKLLKEGIIKKEENG